MKYAVFFSKMFEIVLVKFDITTGHGRANEMDEKNKTSDSMQMNKGFYFRPLYSVFLSPTPDYISWKLNLTYRYSWQFNLL